MSDAGIDLRRRPGVTRVQDRVRVRDYRGDLSIEAYLEVEHADGVTTAMILSGQLGADGIWRLDGSIEESVVRDGPTEETRFRAPDSAWLSLPDALGALDEMRTLLLDRLADRVAGNEVN
jgi:hypothetical protein